MFDVSKFVRSSIVMTLVGFTSGCVFADADSDPDGVSENGTPIVICPESNSWSCDSNCGDGICDIGELSVCPEDCYTPPPAPSVQWSSWLDRDDPSGTGDWETLGDFSTSQVGCSLPAYIEAQTLSGIAWGSTGEQLTVSPDTGLICKNADQSDGICLDYRVRFGCATKDWSALPRSWHEDYTLLTGSIEYFVPDNVSVPTSRFVEAMTFASGGGFSILRLAPNDAHYWVYGTWVRSGDIITVSYYDDHMGITIQEQYKVAELSDDKFRFRRI